MLASSHNLDPRHYQITVLSGLLIYGALALDFEIRWPRVVLTLAVAQASQVLFTRLFGLPRFDPKSALISALSLCLLLRTDTFILVAAAAFVTIAGKFLIRLRGKHVFNPTNFGLIVMMLVSDRVWVSPGQWGSAAFFGFLLACLGGLVIHRAARSDVTYAFLLAYSVLIFARAWWLGDPFTIPLHQLESGAFLIFAFFMISDPKTTPNTRVGRIVYASLVALVAGWIQFALHRPNALIWSLGLCAFTVPLIDRFSPGIPYIWRSRRAISENSSERKPLMSRIPATTTFFLFSCLAFFTALPAQGFCGFYVAKADTSLFNRASSVVLVRDGDRTVVTMSNDYQGDPTEFAMVVPVPTVLEREQIHVTERAVIDHLDAYTSPRLVEYFDANPCERWRDREKLRLNVSATADSAMVLEGQAVADTLGVTIEARYTVGEYDILILSAKESEGLETWLRGNGYRIPQGAGRVLSSYIKQGLRFFVAKVNLEEQSALGYTTLRPLQMAYESPRFMLPIRLGTVNADGPQELFVFTLTRTGRVETTNYRTVKLPTGMNLPPYIKGEFGEFYQAMFSRQVEKERMRTVFLEYAWDMNWCDPCAADPLSTRELRELGVFWVDEAPQRGTMRRRPQPQASNVFVSRLHLRYDAESFPEDLKFQETGDRSNFQGRYVLQHPWKGSAVCSAADGYWREVRRRQETEAQTLASLTGWDMKKIQGQLDLPGTKPAGDKDDPNENDDEPWWKKIWG